MSDRYDELLKVQMTMRDRDTVIKAMETMTAESLHKLAIYAGVLIRSETQQEAASNG